MTMATTPQELTIRVFLSSPGDVKEERLIAYREVESFINYNFLFKRKVRLEAIGWDRAGAYVPMEANIDPQSAINDRIPQSSECDIAIFIFWSRMGTELDSTKYIKPEKYQYDVDENEIRSQYFSGTEFEFVAALNEGNKDDDNHPYTFVFVRRPENSISLSNKAEREEKIRQFDRLERFIENIKYKSEKYLVGHYEKYDTTDVFRDKLRKTLQKIVAEIVADPPAKMLSRKSNPRRLKRTPWVGSPFPGLRPFEENDDVIYFGRDKEISQLIDQVKENRFVAVIGASGAGKSSLVRAGLFPSLKHNAIIQPQDDSRDWEEHEPNAWIVASSQWIILTMKPGEVEEVDELNNGIKENEETFKNPFDALYRTLNTTFAPNHLIDDSATFKELVEKPALNLVKMNSPVNVNKSNELEILRANTEIFRNQLFDFTELLLKDKPRSAEILLLIDQFEELFTLVKDVSIRKAFILFMQQFALCNRSRIIVTMRADVYQDYIQYPELADMITASSFNLAPAGLSALNEMIRCPAEVAGLVFEEDVAETILVDTNTDKNAGALPLMAYLLDQMYERCKNTGRLSMKAYDELGGVGRAITKSAEAVIERLRTKIPTVDKLLYSVFKELVELKTIGVLTRRRASKAKIIVDKATEQLVNGLIEARLLITDRQTDPETGENEEVVEVAHEALLREWDRLSNWINENQDYFVERHRIETDAAKWINDNEDISHLWPHKDLVPFYEALDRLNYLPDIFKSNIQRFMEPEALRLLKELNSSITIQKRRQNIGDRLWALGDLRYGVDITAEGIPQIAWCKVPVPTGEIRLEGIDKSFFVNQFYIAKYPITLTQFNAFVKAHDGFTSEEWWEGLGVDPKSQRVQTQTPPTGNHPAVWVSWFQAVAFCRWLSSKLGYKVRIPLEWEWQQAATGGIPANLYPWGPIWDSNRCNSYDAELNALVSVGLYPLGQSPIGAEDMAGNVVEWCVNTYEQPSATINFQDHAKRTTRGGAYFLTASQRQEGKTAKDVVKTTDRLGDEPSAPAEGRVRVSIRLVADTVPDNQLGYPALQELKGIPQSISNYYINGDVHGANAES